MTSDLNIQIVCGNEGAKLFAQAAHNARKGDSAWTAPFSVETKKLFNAQGTPFNRANPHAFCVAFHNGVPVGRIMVIKHLHHLAVYQDNACHFGFLEAADNPEIIPALMAFAMRWAKNNGLSRLEGPYSASINHEIGLLLNGDGTPTTFKTNDAPSRYAKTLETLGFAPVKDILAVEADITKNVYPDRVAELLSQWPDHHRLVLKSFNIFKLKENVRITNTVYSKAWANNWHMLVPAQDEATFIAKMMLPWIKSSWLKTAYFNGKPVGIASLIPDLNEAARGLGGKLLPFGWFLYLWRLKVRGTKRARLALIGVCNVEGNKRAKHFAASALVANAITQAQRAGVERLEVSWMLEDNAAVLNLTRNLPAQITRRWRIYGKELD